MLKPRDQVEGQPCILDGVLEAKSKEAAEKESRKTEKDLKNVNGGAGVYSTDIRKHYLLASDEWKYDIIPEIIEGHNVADFMDPDILHRLEVLEREDGIRMGDEAVEEFEMEYEDLTPEQREALAEIRRKKSKLIQQHRIKKSTAESRPIVARKFNKDKQFTTERMGRELTKIGLDPSASIFRARSMSQGKKRQRSPEGGNGMDLDLNNANGNTNTISNYNKKLRAMFRSSSPSFSRPPGAMVPGEGFKDSAQKIKAIKLAKKSAKKRNKSAHKGKGDRVIPTLKPKHLFSGKRSTGKTDRR